MQIRDEYFLVEYYIYLSCSLRSLLGVVNWSRFEADDDILHLLRDEARILVEDSPEGEPNFLGDKLLFSEHVCNCRFWSCVV